MRIQHITLASGDVATHRLDMIQPAVLATCRALLPHGGPIPGCHPWRVELQPPVFTIYRGQEPVLTCGYGCGNDDHWHDLVALQERFTPAKPSAAPCTQWLAVVLLPGITHVSRDDLGWLGDFERCLAAALLLPP